MAQMWRVRTALTGPMIAGPAVSTTWFHKTASAQDVADATREFWQAIRAFMDNSLSLQVEHEVYDVNDVNGNIITTENVTPPAVVTGSAAGAALSYATQGRLELLTGVRLGSRQVRGALYIPGVTTGGNNDGVPSTTYRNDIMAAAGTHLSTVDQVVYSRTHGTSFPVAGYGFYPKWAVLRSRRD